MYNVVCVKWGNKYSPEYVNKLHSMVKRNLTLPHRFVCFTENRKGINSDIETKALPPLPITNAMNQGWWFKLSLFQEQLYDLQGRTLYMDLDVVIVDNIDCFFKHTDKFCIIRDWNARHPRVFYNSSVFCYNIGEHSHLWTGFMTDPAVNMKTPGGDQIWITKKLPGAEFWPEEWCRSFKYQSQNGIPEGSKIIVFHGKPDPHEAHDWNFRNKRYKTDWIQDYWK